MALFGEKTRFGKHLPVLREKEARERGLKPQPKSSGKLPLYKGVGVALLARGKRRRIKNCG